MTPTILRKKIEERGHAHSSVARAQSFVYLDTRGEHPLYDGDDMNPSEHIDKEIADHPDWRGQTMAEIRRIIRETVPDVTEEWKWMGTPTWSHNGILCICNAFKDMVKVTFIYGAKLGDVDGLFNAEL